MSRLRGKLVKIIKDAGSKYDDYSISPKIRQILLHWGYELTKKTFYLLLIFFFLEISFNLFINLTN